MGNSLAPGFMRIFYTSNGHPHIQTLPVNPVSPAGAATNLRDKSGASQLWTSALADIVLIEKPFIAVADSFDSAEMWTQASPSSVPLLQDTVAIGVNGTSVTADQAFSQLRFSFRGSDGSRGVFVILEQRYGVDAKFPAPLYAGHADMQAVDAYLTGVNSVVWTRAGAYFASGIRAVSKTNDSLRKKYLQP